MPRSSYDTIIIGGGIAGASFAHFLARRGVTDVLLVEREEHPGTQASGRSAAVLSEVDANRTVLRLKALAAPFLRDPPAGFADAPLLRRDGLLTLHRGASWEAAQAEVPFMESLGIRVERLGPAEAVARVPALAPAEVTGALFNPDDGALDVHELLSAYLRHARAAGVEVATSAGVTAIDTAGGAVRGVLAGGRELRCRRLVNAAGAWAGEVARLAGAAPIVFRPLRRTIVTFAAPPDLDPSGWPFTCHEDERVYFGREPGGLLASPMDTSPSEPCDARPDELAVAAVAEKLAVVAPRLVPRALKSRWAGLRTFSPDGVPVVGPDPLLGGFFWLAGQGGFGIETSPALGAIAADLLVDGRTERFDAALLSPSRFAGPPTGG